MKYVFYVLPLVFASSNLSAILLNDDFSTYGNELANVSATDTGAGSDGVVDFDTLNTGLWYGSRNVFRAGEQSLRVRTATGGRSRPVLYIQSAADLVDGQEYTLNFDILAMTGLAFEVALYDMDKGTNDGITNYLNFDFHAEAGIALNSGVIDPLGPVSFGDAVATELYSNSGTPYTPADVGSKSFSFIAGANDLAIVFNVIDVDGGNADIDNVFIAVPEPSSYALIAGLLGLTSVMLRRRK